MDTIYYTHKRYLELVEELRCHIDGQPDPYTYLLNTLDAEWHKRGREFRRIDVKALWDDEKGSLLVTKCLVELRYKTRHCICETGPFTLSVLGTGQRIDGSFTRMTDRLSQLNEEHRARIQELKNKENGNY